MAEIKSTLDLVMEKTKHLTMTEEEKNRDKINEARRQIKGLVKKYKDGFLNQNKFGKELDRLGDSGADVIRLLKEELLAEVRIDEENQEVMKLLKSFYGVRPDGLFSITDAYFEGLDGARRERIRQNKQSFSKKYNISGTALLPNLDADPGWNKRKWEIRENYRELLESEKEKLSGQ